MKKLYLAVLAIVLAVAVIVPAGGANAVSIEVSGKVQVTAEKWTITEVSGSCMVGQIQRSLTFDGGLKGEAAEELTYCLKFNDGELEFIGEGSQTFTGTLAGGEEGTYTASVLHLGWESKSPLTERFEQTIISSAGGLDNLFGTIGFVIQHAGDDTCEGTYSGLITPFPYTPDIRP